MVYWLIVMFHYLLVILNVISMILYRNQYSQETYY